MSTVDNNEFSGVKLDKRTNKWRARYTAKSTLKRVWLGKMFDTAADAARARDVAAYQFSTPGTKLNFPGEITELLAKSEANKKPSSDDKKAPKAKKSQPPATPAKPSESTAAVADTTAAAAAAQAAKEAARKAALNKVPSAKKLKKRAAMAQKTKSPAARQAKKQQTPNNKTKRSAAVPMDMSSEDDDSADEAVPVRVQPPAAAKKKNNKKDKPVNATAKATPSAGGNSAADICLALAGQANQSIADGSTLESLLSGHSAPALALTRATLQVEKQAAVEAEQYELAQMLKTRIERVTQELGAALQVEKQAAVEAEQYELAQTLKTRIDALGVSAAPLPTPAAAPTPSKRKRSESASGTPQENKTPKQARKQAATVVATPGDVSRSAKKTIQQVREEAAAAKAAAAASSTPAAAAVVPATPTPQQQKAKAKAKESTKPEAHRFLRRDAVKELKRLVTYCAETKQYASDYADLRQEAEDGKNNWLTTSVLSPSVDKLANKKVRLLALDCEMVTGERRVKRIVKGPKPSITHSKKKAPKKRRRSSSSSSTSSSSSSESSELSESSSDTDDETNGGRSSTRGNSTSGSREFERVQVLARVSLVEVPVVDAEEGVKEAGRAPSRVLVDAYVKPPADIRIVDLLTHVSGIEQKHLDDATQSLDDVRTKVMAELGANDILVGHSLNCDLVALKLWHGLMLDTSMFFGVKEAPQLSLALKDVVTMMFGKNSTANAKVASGFQLEGESHDSVKDAEAAARVVLQLAANRIASAKNKQPMALPVEVAHLPERYEKQVRVYNLPDGQTKESVLQLFAPGFSSSKVAKRLAAVSVKPFKWTTLRDEKKVGSTSLTFDTADHALDGFNGVKVDEEVCHKDGFPDSSGFQKKYVRLPGTGSKDEKAAGGRRIDIVTYHRMPELDEEPVRVLHVHPNALGKVLGPGGKRIIALQQMTGTRVRVEKIAPRGSSAKKMRKNGEEPSTAFTVRTDSDLKAMNALKGIHAALKGDKLGVEDSVA